MTPEQIAENVKRLRDEHRWRSTDMSTPAIVLNASLANMVPEAIQTINALVALVGEMHGALRIAISATHESLPDNTHNQNKEALTKAAPIAALAKEK